MKAITHLIVAQKGVIRMSFLSESAEREIINQVTSAVLKALEVNEENKNTNSRFLQTNQAAEYCDISRRTLIRWVENFGLPQSKVGGIILYDIKDLDEFIARHKV